MIQRNRGGDLVAECDQCGDSTEEEIVAVNDWHEFIVEMKTAGWRISRDADDEWQHDCPSCKE